MFQVRNVAFYASLTRRHVIELVQNWDKRFVLEKFMWTWLETLTFSQWFVSWFCSVLNHVKKKKLVLLVFGWSSCLIFLIHLKHPTSLLSSLNKHISQLPGSLSHKCKQRGSYMTFKMFYVLFHFSLQLIQTFPSPSLSILQGCVKCLRSADRRLCRLTPLLLCSPVTGNKKKRYFVIQNAHSPHMIILYKY